MKKNTKKYGIDILIMVITCSVFFALLGIFYMLLKINTGTLPLLVQTLIGALSEFGAMGLGVVIVCARNRERFSSFGLKKEKLLLTILLSALACLPSFILELVRNENITYFPLQTVNFTKPVLAADFPVNLIGMLIIIITWGFFEGFTYVVLSDRINNLLPPKSLLFDWGAIICGIFCLLIHVLVGQSYSLAGAFTEFILIYGMLVGYRYTGNAWGCVLVFCFYWNGISC